MAFYLAKHAFIKSRDGFMSRAIEGIQNFLLRGKGRRLRYNVHGEREMWDANTPAEAIEAQPVDKGTGTKMFTF